MFNTLSYGRWATVEAAVVGFLRVTAYCSDMTAFLKCLHPEGRTRFDALSQPTRGVSEVGEEEFLGEGVLGLGHLFGVSIHSSADLTIHTRQHRQNILLSTQETGNTHHNTSLTCYRDVCV
jgi:hypothetical protein